MPRERLTDTRVANFRPPKEALLRDTESHLAVRARPTGSKVFVFMSTLNYKDIRITIGEVGAVALADARRKAQAWQELVDQGRDPRDVIQEQARQDERERAARAAELEAQARDASAKAVTVGEAWAAYLEARGPKWGERHMRNHLAMAKAGGEPRGRGRRKGESETVQPGPLYPLLAIRLCELDAEKVKAWLEPLAERTPTQAAQTYRALRAFLSWCGDQPEFCAVTHSDACNRRMARDTLPRARAKDDCLQREQLAGWFLEVKKIGNPIIAAYLQALLLTGARREELAGLRWEDVDFKWKSLTIRDKVEGERTIPLTPYVASVLVPLPRRTIVRDGEQVSLPWVFSSPTAASGRLQEPRIQHVKALSAAGLPHLSLHGLRRSFATLAEWVEAPAGIVAQIMGHKPSAIAEKHYRRRPLDLLRMWHTKIEEWILEQAGIELPSAEQVARMRVLP
ncbi:integrase family protein [Aromatoleum toluolicum]|uniref:Tyrosine-type recombinase/integrase n=1 Tax=Aromatoleum toluolicum TaxID=90060 RepID=A0ABX1NG96_9RHOO|nr:integrase family protein [Aromatoleum toluolicum]NMF98198.1 integrase family protein [Aromatoleum toluolicum]